MIPERREPQVNKSAYFGEEHGELLEQVVDQLSLSGRIVVLDSGHEAYTAYCLRSIIENLAMSSSSGSETGGIKVRRVRQEREFIIASLNRSVKDLGLAGAYARNAVNTKELWIFENAQSTKSEEIVFASNLARKFKSAGISIVITGRSTGLGVSNVEKLTEFTKGTSFIFSLPEEEEFKNLYKQANLVGAGTEYASLMENIGIKIEARKDPEILAFAGTKGLEPHDDLVASLEENIVISPNRWLSLTRQKLVYFGGCALLAIALAALPIYADFDGAIKLASRVSLPEFLSPVENELVEEGAVPLEKGAPGELQNIKAASVNYNLEILTLPEIELPEPVSLEESRTLLIDPTPSSYGDFKIRANTEPSRTSIAASSAEGKVIYDSMARQGSPALVLANPNPIETKIIARSKKWFVQHASFQAPQRAFLWKSNQRLDDEMMIYSKGETAPRFVVVSGPFDNKGFAESYLEANNIVNDKFFVPGENLVERIFP